MYMYVYTQIVWDANRKNLYVHVYVLSCKCTRVRAEFLTIGRIFAYVYDRLYDDSMVTGLVIYTL